MNGRGEGTKERDGRQTFLEERKKEVKSVDIQEFQEY